MTKFEEEVKRPAIGIEQSSIKPSLGKAIEFYTGKVKEYHNAFKEMNKYIDSLEAQLDYYKKDKRFEVKEKRFYLKNKLTGFYLYKAFGGKYGEESVRYGAGDFGEDYQFTQQEIDSMAADSYEKIEVEE